MYSVTLSVIAVKGYLEPITDKYAYNLCLYLLFTL